MGLNFDYVSLNLVGFLMYALFNCGLYWIPEIEKEYFERYPKGLNPVQINDIFFSLHAVFASIIVIGQCFIYETGNQRVSTTARIIHGIFATFILISLILSSVKTIQWLDFLYYCSYVKLSVTLIKYVPQAFYNYRRKSTVGWSIGNVFLDFTGGILSMLQMILNAYNYDDWESIFGDPTKFGLGFFSVAFDVFFLIQHYVLYRNRADYAELTGHCQEEPEGAYSAWKYEKSLITSQNHRPLVRTLKSNTRRNAPSSLRRTAHARYPICVSREEDVDSYSRPPALRSEPRSKRIDLLNQIKSSAVSPGSRGTSFTVLWRRTIAKLYRSSLLSGRIARKKHPPPVCVHRTERNA